MRDSTTCGDLNAKGPRLARRFSVRAAPSALVVGLATALVAGAAPGVEAQESIIRIEAAYLGTSDVTRSLSGPATEAHVTVYRASAFLPLVVQREGFVFIPRLSASRVGVAPQPMDPIEPVWVEALYDLDFELIFQRALSARSRLLLVVAPGLASDLRPAQAGHLTLQGVALLTRESASGTIWGGGLSVTNAFGETLLVPVATLQWRGSGLYADVLAPARGEVLWTPGGGIAAGVQIGVDGNAYGLGREGTLEGGRVRYSVAKAGPVVRLDLGGRYELSVAGGASFGRRLQVEDAGGIRVEDAALRSGWHLRVSLAWLIPRVTSELGSVRSLLERFAGPASRTGVPGRSGARAGGADRPDP